MNSPGRVWLQPGNSTEFTFTIEEDSPGEHIVDVNGLQGSFFVKAARSPSTSVFLVVGELLVIIVALWIFRFRKR